MPSVQIVPGTTYRVSPRAARSFEDMGRSYGPGRTFKAADSTKFNGNVVKGVALGLVIEEPTGTAANRAARFLVNQLGAREYLLHDSNDFATNYRLMQTNAAFAFQAANSASIAVTLGAVADTATSIGGTTSIACTLQTIKNGVALGAPFAAPGGAYTHAIAAAEAGDVYGVYAIVVGPPVVRLTNTVFQTVSNDVAPAITGSYTAASTTVSGTSAADDGDAANIYINGSTTPSGTPGTVVGGAWSVTGLILKGTDSLTAKIGSGSTQSPASAAVIVHFSAPVITPTPANTDTVVSGTSTDAVGGHTINIYSDNPAPNTLIGTAVTTPVTGAWTATGVTAVTTGDSLYATLGAGANLSAHSATVVV